MTDSLHLPYVAVLENATPAFHSISQHVQVIPMVPVNTGQSQAGREHYWPEFLVLINLLASAFEYPEPQAHPLSLVNELLRECSNGLGVGGYHGHFGNGLLKT